MDLLADYDDDDTDVDASVVASAAPSHSLPGEWATLVTIDWAPTAIESAELNRSIGALHACIHSVAQKYHKVPITAPGAAAYLLALPFTESVTNLPLHVSLSRAVNITQALIDPLLTALVASAAAHAPFDVDYMHAQYLLNWDGGVPAHASARVFGALVVREGAAALNRLIDSVDDAFARFGLPAFYSPRTPHMSIAAADAARVPAACPELFADLKDALVVPDPPLDLRHRVRALTVHVGNRRYQLPLKT